ncbi:piggyBac transposable element-derived protein 4-like [Agrilus planipennis]|uniref:PiggyBac transposable element-derived protein 4-like n=1 Tax=Agrilus planipennis TaxID=224129 RepID=A0A1W4WUL1_AGRPL|nr:piggyBac transposable element-derived protein 4-like [Agrilus planipennis]
MEDTKKRKLTSDDPSVWLKWFEEMSEEENEKDEESCSEIEADILEESPHETGSEQEAGDLESDNDCDDISDSESENFYIGKDKFTKWCKVKPRQNVRTRSCNIIIHLPDPRREAHGVQKEIDILKFFLDDNVFRMIVASTNIKIGVVREKYCRARDAADTDVTEIRAFIGLLYLIGSLRCSRKYMHDLWDNSRGNGLESCYLKMSENRFKFLLQCLRFDDIRDRHMRKEVDKLCSIRDLHELLINNFQRYFCASEYLTVDEQLLAFRGNCSFRQYIPSKPAKYGLKIFALVDCKTGYTINLEPYVGKQPEGPYQVGNSGEEIVLRLCNPVEGTNRNITADNWFTSVTVSERLLLEKKLTYVGTMRKNKREIPKEFLPNRSIPAKSSIFGFGKNSTLVSYCPKKGKSVILLSSMHFDDTIDVSTGDHKKPEIVTFYNMTKVGVDLVDQLCQKYDVSRNTRRWPLVMFYNLLNISAINAFVIYKANTRESRQIQRRIFLQNISWELIKPQIERRTAVLTIPKEIRRRARVLLRIEESTVPQKRPGTMRGAEEQNYKKMVL